MRGWNIFIWVIEVVAVFAQAKTATDGILDLVKRRLPAHVDDFIFNLQGYKIDLISSSNPPTNDKYNISSTDDGKILVEGNSLGALASG
jgi:alpha-N-acetylglucosaminidase